MWVNCRYVIEKELCNPVDAYTIPGPFYHVYRLDGNSGEKENIQTFEGDIREAARYVERQVDFDELEIAYQKSPSSILSSKVDSWCWENCQG